MKIIHVWMHALLIVWSLLKQSWKLCGLSLLKNVLVIKISLLPLNMHKPKPYKGVCSETWQDHLWGLHKTVKEKWTMCFPFVDKRLVGTLKYQQVFFACLQTIIITSSSYTIRKRSKIPTGDCWKMKLSTLLRLRLYTLNLKPWNITVVHSKTIPFFRPRLIYRHKNTNHNLGYYTETPQ